MNWDERYSEPGFAYGTGGPHSLDMLMSLDKLKLELAGLKFVHAVRIERKVQEESRHTGLASVVQVMGIKP